MIKLTLDTNALRDLAWLLGESPDERYKDEPKKQVDIRNAFIKILQMRDNKQVELGVTTQFYADFWKTRSVPPPHLNNLIGEYVEIGLPGVFSFPLVFPIEFPDKAKYERLFADVFPSSQPKHDKYKYNRLDAWQLYAHIITGRDIFITTDNGILQQASLLEKKWSVIVTTPVSFVDSVAL